MIHKVTPLLIVDQIEPCLTFWQGHLKYVETVRVPHGDAAGFVILEQGSSEIMLQTRKSLADDLPAVLALDPAPSSLLYIHVSSIDAAVAAAEAGGARVIVPLRTTFYGAREVFVTDPQGNVVAFAEQSGG